VDFFNPNSDLADVGGHIQSILSDVIVGWRDCRASVVAQGNEGEAETLPNEIPAICPIIADTRQTSATISTNIEVTIDDETVGTDGWFEWFERTGTGIRYKAAPGGKKRISHVRVTVGKWLFNAIVKDRKILTYAKAYFDLEPIPRRLYDLARVHVGNQDRWQVRLPKLQARIGDRSRLTHFLSALIKLEAEDPLPEYRFRIVEQVRPGAKRRSQNDLARVLVVFTRKGAESSRESGKVIDLPSREVKYPGLVTELRSRGFTGRLAFFDRLKRRAKETESLEPDRSLADDPVALAVALVDAGLEAAR
jgi:hypothetical protein